MKNWNFNGSLKENNKRVLTEAEGSVNMIGARKDPSVSFNNDNGKLKMTLNIPAGSGSSGGGSEESGVGRTYITEDGESRGEYFNVYEAPEGTDYIGNAWGYGSHAEGGNLWRSDVSQTPSYLEYDAEKIPYDIIARDTLFTAGSCVYIHTSAAIGLNSHAEGYQCIAAGDASHAEGYKTFADSSACGASHAEGYKTRATGKYSHAEGYNTVASEGASHAEGTNTNATGWGSHAEGCGTISACDYSHAEGYSTKANRNMSHAEGNSTIAEGVGAHAEGNTTIAGSDYQHVQGKYNIADYNNKYAMIIGNGTGSSSDRRANALTVDWGGNQTIAGELYIKNSSQPLIRCLTQSEYDNLATKNPYTLYLIKEE